MRPQARQILMRRLMTSGVSIAQILVKQAQKRIKDKGSDVGGYADLWANRVGPIKVPVRKGSKKTKDVYHYRKGGTPLYDTGNLFRSMASRTELLTDGVRLILTAPLYALFHQHGFKTTGPNFIPFTRGAVRRDPAALAKREFVVARHGVTVPKRPIMAMPETSRREVARTIARALGAR